MGSASRLFSHGPGPPAARVPSPAARSIADLVDAYLTEPSGPAALPGLADLQSAIVLVATGAAHSITLCGFPDGAELVRAAQAEAVDGIVIEPVIRTGGGGVDVRVRVAPSAEG